MNSVCIATYNGEKFIEEQIRSILLQLDSHDEIVISDDHSTDKTIQIIKSINDDRIKIIYNKNNKGYTNNFENAISKASGDFIYLSDQDDVWKPTKVKVYKKYFETYDFVVSNAEIVDQSLNSINSETYFDLRGVSSGFVSDLIKAKSLGCCMAFNKKVLKKVLPFPENKELCPHDLWILLMSEFYFKCKIIDEPLILYRRHENTVSTGGNTNNNSLLFMLKFRLYSFYKVLSRI